MSARESFSRSAIEHACHAAGFEPAAKLESGSPLALTRLAEQGVGVAVIPDALVPADFAGRMLAVSGAGDILRREIWLSSREGALRSASRSSTARRALVAKGALRSGITAEQVKDLLWATTGSEMYRSLVHERAWTPEQYQALETANLASFILPGE